MFMKLAMAQMRMAKEVDENLEKTLDFCDKAKGCDLLFFPEVQLSPFFAQYEARDASNYLLSPEDPRLQAIEKKCRELGMYISICPGRENPMMPASSMTGRGSFWAFPKWSISSRPHSSMNAIIIRRRKKASLCMRRILAR